MVVLGVIMENDVKLQDMMCVPGKWLFIVIAPVTCCVISLFFRLGRLVSYVHRWAWLGWTAMTLLLLNGVRAAECKSVIVVCSLLAFLLSLSLPSFSDVSVRQWLMSPPRTWLIFHLQPASQLFTELSTGLHTSAYSLSSAQWRCGFVESKDWCITCLCLYMNHLVFRISHPSEFLLLHVCFFIDQGETWEWRMSPNASCASLSLPLASVYGNQCFHSIHVPLFIGNPRSTEIKSAFQQQRLKFYVVRAYCAAEAASVLALHCLLMVWEHQTPRRAQLCSFTNQRSCISPLHLSCFFFFFKPKVREG